MQVRRWALGVANSLDPPCRATASPESSRRSFEAARCEQTPQRLTCPATAVDASRHAKSLQRTLLQTGDLSHAHMQILGHGRGTQSLGSINPRPQFEYEPKIIGQVRETSREALDRVPRGYCGRLVTLADLPPSRWRGCNRRG
jgi:hypothetical protein